jgi:chemotaxis protein MotC
MSGGLTSASFGTMRRGCLRCCAVSVLAVIAVGTTTPTHAAPPAETGVIAERPPVMITERQPHHAVRMLGALQERIAHGDEAAVPLQQAVVLEITQELKSYPPEVWTSVRNRQALIKFALSGGDPTLLQLVLSRKLFAEGEVVIAQAALAYALGNRSVTLRLLDKVDVYDLPPSLAGHLALVKAIVVANTDLARVVRLCDDARLLSPGTLVEETALRLAIEATITQGDQAKFEAIALRYFRRFPRSPFLSAVIRPVARAIAEGGYSERPEGARWVHAIVQYLDPNKLVVFYTAVAEASLQSSRLATTIHAARMAQKYARKGSTEESWALAYEGSALVIGADRKQGLARLAAAQSIGGNTAVRELIDAARSVATLIEQPPPILPATEAALAAAPAPAMVAPLRAGLPAEGPSPAIAPAPAGAAVPTLAASPTPLRAPTPAPSSAGGTPAAVNALARIAQVDKLLKDIDE